MFLKNKNIFKIGRSKVTDYAALSVWLTINKGVSRVSMSSNYFRDCVQPNRLIFEVIFSTTDNKLIY